MNETSSSSVSIRSRSRCCPGRSASSSRRRRRRRGNRTNPSVAPTRPRRAPTPPPRRPDRAPASTTTPSPVAPAATRSPRAAGRARRFVDPSAPRQKPKSQTNPSTSLLADPTMPAACPPPPRARCRTPRASPFDASSVPSRPAWRSWSRARATPALAPRSPPTRFVGAARRPHPPTRSRRASCVPPRFLCARRRGTRRPCRRRPGAPR
mmetsp:Transcript_10105/g.40843  ORF Transcript_10105/g.40843 Transcript_10105/m.40843 type:complete len:209 (+) Transcript_10105:6375-7001(+)